MLGISWNARGLGRKEKRRFVRDLVKEHNPTVCFIQETELAVFDKNVIRALGEDILTRRIGVDAIGKAGGLISLWNERLLW
ncbi:hypothetical protein Dsin_000704 [Dipteronia sinensis]|uniref:Endonuclease/exonuclease/phosphatase domain-containing protein n=1 Tax=Dipteronia sinensis TaxID=43782 RepID=A0AAE0B2J2_9ROSI|nr:hypothetical protein Dsin_000704 [Dipteronia sinensis]